MTLRSCFWIAILFFVAARPAGAQNEPWRGSADDPRRRTDQPAAQAPPYQTAPRQTDPRQTAPYRGAPAQAAPSYQGTPRQTAPYQGPYQVRPPEAPTIHRRQPQQQAGPPQRPPRPPFVLTPQQQQQVDWVLQRWEQQNKGVKTFECNFTRFEYDKVFGDANKPKFTDTGRIWYSAPDRGRFEVHGQRAEKWICDGKSIFEYSYQKKQLIQHDLPPEMQGKAISEGPLPFLFGATAASLKQRYFLRLLAPPKGVEGQVWIEAYPATQQGLANFSKAEMIFATDGMRPWALQIYLPNGNRTAYRFTDIKVNPNNPLGVIFGPNPYRPTVPTGWQKIVEPVPVAQNPGAPAGQAPSGGQAARPGVRSPAYR